MKKLKNRRDNEEFRISKRASGAAYTLQKKNPKTKTAVITSNWSGRSFEMDWNTVTYSFEV